MGSGIPVLPPRSDNEVVSAMGGEQIRRVTSASASRRRRSRRAPAIAGWRPRVRMAPVTAP